MLISSRGSSPCSLTVTTGLHRSPSLDLVFTLVFSLSSYVLAWIMELGSSP
uniref:Uncharacterized protein n=1 Tax=Anguilla anguilla TaxID=7936 RepID=A0A0E9T1J6_ANGAN